MVTALKLVYPKDAERFEKYSSLGDNYKIVEFIKLHNARIK